MTEEERGHLEIEDRGADHAQNTKGATIMMTNEVFWRSASTRLNYSRDIWGRPRESRPRSSSLRRESTSASRRR